MKKKPKIKLSEKLISDKLFKNEKELQSWVMLGKVLINNQPVRSAAMLVGTGDCIRIKDYYQRYVNRGGLKLEGALRDFGIDVQGKIALDAGASTGGFTDCLIQSGCGKVYAVDVGFGQLCGTLRQNARVVNLEKTNLGDKVLLELKEPPEIITLDLSYLSLKEALPLCSDITKGKGIVVALVKPLFEVESSASRREGIVSGADYNAILHDLAKFFSGAGFGVFGVTHSPIRGNSGTTEFFMAIALDGERSMPEYELKQAIAAAIKAADSVEEKGKHLNDYYSAGYVSHE